MGVPVSVIPLKCPFAFLFRSALSDFSLSLSLSLSLSRAKLTPLRVPPPQPCIITTRVDGSPVSRLR
jgi:hypothetical protein